MYGASDSLDDDPNALRFGVEVIDRRCQASGVATMWRPCGSRLVRISASPALVAAAATANTPIRDGEEVCVGGRMCGLKTGLRLSGLLALLR